DGAAEAVAVDHDLVSRLALRRRRHPEPERGLPGDGGVGGHELGVLEQRAAERRAGSAVVVVPAELNGSTSLVALAGRARVRGVVRVAVVADRIELLDVNEIAGLERDV